VSFKNNKGKYPQKQAQSSKDRPHPKAPQASAQKAEKLTSADPQVANGNKGKTFEEELMSELFKMLNDDSMDLNGLMELMMPKTIKEWELDCGLKITKIKFLNSYQYRIEGTLKEDIKETIMLLDENQDRNLTNIQDENSYIITAEASRYYGYHYQPAGILLFPTQKLEADTYISGSVTVFTNN
jgi:hypothetical protein